MSQVVYSAQKSGFQKGRVYLNPRFFDGTCKAGVSSVIVIGDWPTVVKTYEDASIPVKVVAIGERLPSFDDGDDNVSKEVNTDHPKSTVKGKGKDVGKIDPPVHPDKDPDVEIPENYADLAFRDQKELIAKIDPTADISSKKDATAWLAAKVGEQK